MNKLIKELVAFFTISLLTVGQAQAAATVTFYHHDALGSVIASSHEDGYINWDEEYQPYGEKVRGTVDDEGGSEDWYTGKNYNQELDLTYFGARWYDAKQGRFLSMDPARVQLANIHSFNRYQYANSNPYKYVDPDGEASIPNSFSNQINRVKSQAEAQVVNRKIGRRKEVVSGIQNLKTARRQTAIYAGAADTVFTNGAIAAGIAQQPEVAIPAALIAGSAKIIKFIAEPPTTGELGAELADQLISEAIPHPTGKVFVEVVGPFKILEKVISTENQNPKESE